MCLKVAMTKWLYMHSSSKWIKNNIICVQEHLDLKNPNYTPTNNLYIFHSSVDLYADEARRVFFRLQGLTTLLYHKQTQISGLVHIYYQMNGTRGPL